MILKQCAVGNEKWHISFVKFEQNETFFKANLYPFEEETFSST